ncbi:MAG: TetR family transcriptional regulator [Dechloromonas sp.]|nr:TetR family transcriptional regulator [Dechloromonas sp.]
MQVTNALPPAGSGKRTRLSAAERRCTVVAAVIELARDNGPEGITTQAIADRIGVTHGALFRHFPDKAAMWVAVFDWVRDELGTVVDKAFAAGGEPLVILKRVFHAHVGFIARHPGVPRILFHELQRPADSAFHERVRSMVGGYRQRLCDLMKDAKRHGQLPASLDEEAAAVLFIGTVQGLVVQSTLFRGEAGMQSAARRIFPLLLHGLQGKSK